MDRLLFEGEEVVVTAGDLLCAAVVIVELMARFVGRPDTPQVRAELEAVIQGYLGVVRH